MIGKRYFSSGFVGSTETFTVWLLRRAADRLLALLAALGINQFTAFSALVRMQMILLSVAVSAAIGIVFGFFDGIGGMAMVAGWWGIWDIIAGLILASWWAKRPGGMPHRVAEP